ncbi:hypothetical protein MPTK1_5g18260 [Marchantia polymorpha subsp. ruderalis]|uniref:Uncharacterized protein n=2 Tax=Marchantia polymorpha TaxID=3197 RepID=A0AAF6BJP0_MARPO|nr:hypothetical protein MARPO_0084s0074 [Marchantia polymorpha]BBN12224.1 hypothetical protein Mp_5g18260 [Marchantia polymorpha subsp. ruderalis]|eukprot:PTQ34012.1 hypothetical protein MARPO_0084s0074 [Marchantia polymorpha]
MPSDVMVSDSRFQQLRWRDALVLLLPEESILQRCYREGDVRSTTQRQLVIHPMGRAGPGLHTAPSSFTDEHAMILLISLPKPVNTCFSNFYPAFLPLKSLLLKAISLSKQSATNME